jgi:hypothetical protein
MALQDRFSDLITVLGTDYKQFRTWITGSNSGDLTGLTTTDKSSLLAAINEVDAKPSDAPDAASETVAGIIEIATQSETDAGSLDNRSITPLKFQTRLAAFAQPLSSALTTLAGVTSGAFGRQLLETVDAPEARTALGLAAVATTGSASDITTGVLPASVIPPLAINEVFAVASQSEMLALTAERGDVAIRSDETRSYILAVDDPSVLANWKQLTAGGDVTSVAGRTGSVVLAKDDVGLGNVDNTTDATKPVSSDQAAADALRMLKSANLSDLTSLGAARTNLSVYSRAELGDPETDLAALYATAKA